ncbi:MAG: TonB system transport protein ExbD [Enterobacterales bacterium]|jgi:biopolymer transport protein ExbD|uniref:Biopolymer transport protein ExbD n=2 Tax=Hafnia alvei TaxID=569 RepID=A0A2J9HG40_HAFAL|nr:MULTISPECIES: TonB system transport protein ExbD [Hafniaceae]MDN5450042.1 TonB system transport protein ExbD [Enterobacterales bacterium]MDN5987331.1 TonB system transport protein ExbD [Hafniaceae bacterium]NEY26875.1 TonB system transport protein ExbD [Escherichia coli]AWV45870.1 TonB system transport protein ExbD [Hafnia alvei]KFC85488.1 biopolymer transport protein [Hafnia alvei ATCC 13337]
MALHIHDYSAGESAESREIHDINVTPFIDVMLVLLIIFMVAAPLATVDIRVNLPASSAQPQPRPDKPVYLTIKADKQLYLGDALTTSDRLSEQLNEQTKADKDTTIFLQADKAVDYATLMTVMDTLRTAGYLKVGLVSMESVAP